MVKYDIGIGNDSGMGEVVTSTDISNFPELRLVTVINQIIDRNRGTPWGVKTGGSITSRPLFHEGILYFGANDHNFYAIDADTGKELWRFGTDDLVSVYGSPAIWRDRIIFSCYNGKMYCLSLDGKKVLWVFKAKDRIATTPLIHNDIVYFGSKDQNFYAISAETGNDIWKLPMNQEVVCSPIMHDDTILFASRQEIYRIDLNARILWKLKVNGDVNHLHLHDDIIYFGASDRNVYAVSLQGSIIWKYPTDGPVIPEVMIFDENIYIGSMDFNVYCLDMNGNLKWRFPTGDIIATKCLLVDGNIVFSSFDKCLYCVSKSGTLVWKAALEVIPYMILVEDVIYAPGWDCRMRALDKKGKVVWEFKTSLGYMSDIEMDASENLSINITTALGYQKELGVVVEKEKELGSYGDFKGNYIINVDLRDYTGSEVKQGVPGMAYKSGKRIYKK